MLVFVHATIVFRNLRMYAFAVEENSESIRQKPGGRKTVRRSMRDTTFVEDRTGHHQEYQLILHIDHKKIFAYC